MMRFSLPFLAAVAVGASGRVRAGEWYAALENQAWTAPAWVFGPVGQCSMCSSPVDGWLVWRAVAPGATLAAWIVQLVFNGAWSFAMLALRNRPRDDYHRDALLAILTFMVLAHLVSRTATLCCSCPIRPGSPGSDSQHPDLATELIQPLRFCYGRNRSVVGQRAGRLRQLPAAGRQAARCQDALIKSMKRAPRPATAQLRRPLFA